MIIPIYLTKSQRKLANMTSLKVGDVISYRCFVTTITPISPRQRIKKKTFNGIIIKMDNMFLTIKTFSNHLIYGFIDYRDIK
jgi:hypothetical protein